MSATRSATSGAARPASGTESATVARPASAACGAVGLVRSIGADQQHGPGRRRPGQKLQQVQRGPVGPVQVIQDDHGGVSAAGGPSEQPAHRAEHPRPGIAGQVRAAGQLGDDDAELR